LFLFEVRCSSKVHQDARQKDSYSGCLGASINADSDNTPKNRVYPIDEIVLYLRSLMIILLMDVKPSHQVLKQKYKQLLRGLADLICARIFSTSQKFVISA
jgi:hypothetical protein